jgi:hypothetical protein
VNDWISVHDELPEETQAYGCTTDLVHVKSYLFNGLAYLARTTTGDRWFSGNGSIELHGVTHWRY